ncbi:MAG TPA: LacI family DNA-binding transcriptional regulator [Thermoanaerobaculia bacterium]|jgi:LacI family transcriptional regulator|nr:LacI family DNA-binding transcriptional regulator [Thermoanaerobaculia bacterium]
MPRAPVRTTDIPPNATIRDVAAKAGVSVATVSRVFNQKGPIREATVRRVMDVAGALQYIPHAGARSLSTRSTRTIGVVLPDLHGEFFSEVIRGIDLAARESGYHLLLSGSHSDRDEMRAVVQAVRGMVDGLIVMSPDLEPSALVGELPAGIPTVLLNAKVDGRPSITIDNAGGARDVVRHLASLGHKHIAFIGGPAKNADAEQRRRGFRAGAKAHGVDPVELTGNFTEDSGYEAGKAIAAMSPRPTAVFAANDSMAIGALSAFRDARVRVPDHIALVGFDDIPIARFLDPPLTTVKVPIAELGRRGLQILLSGDTQATQAARLETSLVVRRSCGAQQSGVKQGLKQNRKSQKKR